jgi:pimeloyl-ACP methyl ester carboxylesterase
MAKNRAKTFMGFSLSLPDPLAKRRNYSVSLKNVTLKILQISLLLPTLIFAQPASPTTNEPMPQQALLAIFKRELGNLYQPNKANDYLAAHQAMEKYFAASTGEERKAILAMLETSGVDPNVLGRLARIRSAWPALTGGGVYYVNEHIGPMDAHYFLGVPKTYDRATPWPLVVKLPTADAFVGNAKPNADDVQRIYTDWVSAEIAHHPDALVIMPLLNLDDLWGPSYAGMNSVIGPILHVGERANVDVARTYLIGHSMSGHAAWNLPLHYPTYFTGTNPLAGSASGDWQRLRIRNLANLLVVPWADTDDKMIKVDFTRQLVTLLKRFKIDVDYTETKGIGHVPTDAIADQCYAKLRARKRELYPKQIVLQSNRPETIFNRIDWLQIYQPMNAGDEKKMFFKNKPGHMTVMSNTWSVQASRDGNHFDVTTDNVEIFRILVNDQMIDFGKPVTVTVNKRPRFEGMVKPDVEQMLNDQVFLGRGFRYFTGVIDIDLAPPPTTSTRPSSQQSEQTPGR